MAKKENREGIALQCTVCKEINYLTSKNKKNTDGKLEINKFCSRCNKSTTQEITFNAGIKMEKADVRKNQLSYLYSTGDAYVFMDNNTYDQIEIPATLVENEAKFLKEGMNVESMVIEGEVVGITLPEKVSYKVISAPEAVKGNTTSTAQKDVTIETGYTLKAPLFISEGEEIVITTRDGKYFSRG